MPSLFAKKRRLLPGSPPCGLMGIRWRRDTGSTHGDEAGFCLHNRRKRSPATPCFTYAFPVQFPTISYKRSA